ncbi:hypothetical protein CQA18_27250, partial [Enterobacter hormaechei]
ARVQREIRRADAGNYLQARHLVVTPWNEQRGVKSYPEIDEVSWLEDEYVAICSPAFSAKYGELTLETTCRRVIWW